MSNEVVTNQEESNADLKEKLSNRIQLLKEALASNNSATFDMPNELKYIHSTLKNNPHITYLLEDEEIGVIVQGFSKETNIVLLAPKIKTPKKATPQLSLEDI